VTKEISHQKERNKLSIKYRIYKDNEDKLTDATLQATSSQWAPAWLNDIPMKEISKKKT
jgi:hypothetical protein